MQYIPHSEIEPLDSERRIQLILDAVLSGKIVLLEGRLKAEEEAKLIERTMAKIDNDFKGIEISAVNSVEGHPSLWKKIKEGVAYALLGERHGLTIVGPADILKEIRKDPGRVQMFLEEKKNPKRKK